MTGFFLDHLHPYQFRLENFEQLKPTRLDNHSEDITLSIRRVDDSGSGDGNDIFLPKNGDLSLTSGVLFHKTIPDLWKYTERNRLSSKNHLYPYDAGTYEIVLHRAGEDFLPNSLDLIGGSLVASFPGGSGHAAGGLGNDFKVSLGSPNTNIAPLQQIHTSKYGYPKEQHDQYVIPVRPGLGDKYYDLDRFIEQDALSVSGESHSLNPLRLKEWLSVADTMPVPAGIPEADKDKYKAPLINSSYMKDVNATTSIYEQHHKLPREGSLKELPRSPRDPNKVLVSVVFDAGNKFLGYRAGEENNLLQLNPNNDIKPNDASKSVILPPVPKQDWADRSFVFTNLKNFLSKPGDSTADSAMWVTAEGDLYDYLHTNPSEFSVDMPLGLRNNKSPSLRVQSALGMRDYDKTYVATLEVYPEILFRPKGGYEYDDLSIGAPMHNGESVFYEDSGGWSIKDDWEERWLSSYEPYVKGLGKKTDAENGFQQWDNFSDFYKHWWDKQVKNPTLALIHEDIQGKPYGDPFQSRFPWTGLGYTYDYFYSPDSWHKESNNAKGVGEFVVLPRPLDEINTSDYLDANNQEFNPWEYKVLDVKTINQFLKDSNDTAHEFPGLNIASGDSIEMKVNIKKLGCLENLTLYIYECDPVTGNIIAKPGERVFKNPDPTVARMISPGDSGYHDAIVNGGYALAVTPDQMPGYMEEINIARTLDSTKNYGLLLQRSDGTNATYSSSYDRFNNPFVVLGDSTDAARGTAHAIAYGIEDFSLTSAACDHDYNDLIVTMEYVI